MKSKIFIYCLIAMVLFTGYSFANSYVSYTRTNNLLNTNSSLLPTNNIFSFIGKTAYSKGYNMGQNILSSRNEQNFDTVTTSSSSNFSSNNSSSKSVRTSYSYPVRENFSSGVTSKNVESDIIEISVDFSLVDDIVEMRFDDWVFYLNPNTHSASFREEKCYGISYGYSEGASYGYGWNPSLQAKNNFLNSLPKTENRTSYTSMGTNSTQNLGQNCSYLENKNIDFLLSRKLMEDGFLRFKFNPQTGYGFLELVSSGVVWRHQFNVN